MNEAIQIAVDDERQRLEKIIEEAEKKLVQAKDNLETQRGRNRARYDQNAKIEAIEEMASIEVADLGTSTKLNSLTDEPSLDVLARLEFLLTAAGYPIRQSEESQELLSYNPTTDSSASSLEIAIAGGLTVGGLIEWIEDNRPKVGQPKQEAQKAVAIAQQELKKAEDTLEAFGNTDEEQTAWVRDKGLVTEDQLPRSERKEFREALSNSLVDEKPEISVSVFTPPKEVEVPEIVETEISELEESPTLETGTDTETKEKGIITAESTELKDPDPASLGQGLGKIDWKALESKDWYKGMFGVPAIQQDGSAEINMTEPDEVMKQVLGYGGRFLTTDSNDPLFEVAEILRKAAVEEWDELTLKEALFPTTWWQNTAPRARNLQKTESVDPAKAKALLAPALENVTETANQIGITLTTERASQIARSYYIEEWDGPRLQNYLFMEADWDVGKAGGVVQDNYRVVDILSNDYMVGHLIDPSIRDTYAKRLATGEETEAGLRAEFSRMAGSAYGLIEDRLNQGYSTQEIMSPYRMEIARQLDILDSNSIDFVNDEKYMPFLTGVGEGAGMMTIGAVGEYIRKSPKLRPLWERTDSAKRNARSFADFVTQKFGGLG